MQPKVSIIIVNYNGSNEIFRLVDSLMNLEYQNKHIIIVDNASADNSGVILKNKWRNNPVVEVFLNNSNIGYTGACNIGIESAITKNSKYIVILNFDVEIINYKIIQQMVDYMEKIPKIGIAGPKVYINKSGEIQDTVILFFGLLGYTIDWIKVNVLKNKKPYNIKNPIKADAVNGVFAIYRTQVFRGTGLFDPYLNMYGDEIDIGIRAKNKGWEVYALPLESIIHKPSGDYGVFELRTFLNKRNKVYLARKFYGKAASFCWFILAFFNILAQILFFLCKGDIKMFRKGRKFLKKYVKEIFEIWRYDIPLEYRN